MREEKQLKIAASEFNRAQKNRIFRQIISCRFLVCRGNSQLTTSDYFEGQLKIYGAAERKVAVAARLELVGSKPQDVAIGELPDTWPQQLEGNWEDNGSPSNEKSALKLLWKIDLKLRGAIIVRQQCHWVKDSIDYFRCGWYLTLFQQRLFFFQTNKSQ